MSYTGDKRRRIGVGGSSTLASGQLLAGMIDTGGFVGGSGSVRGPGSNAGDGEYSLYVPQPSTSRTAAKARQDRLQQEQAARQSQTRPKDDPPAVLDLASLPPQALQRYLSRYGLLESHGTLSYHHAVFPVPPLAATLTPPLNGRTLIQAKRPSATAQSVTTADNTTPIADNNSNIVADPAHAPSNMATTTTEAAQVQSQVEQGEQPAAVTVGKGRKRTWDQPHTTEFKDLTAYDHPQLVMDRLAARAKSHWDQREGVKEGETLTNFMFALRMRAHTLRATPPG